MVYSWNACIGTHWRVWLMGRLVRHETWQRVLTLAFAVRKLVFASLDFGVFILASMGVMSTRVYKIYESNFGLNVVWLYCYKAPISTSLLAGGASTPGPWPSSPSIATCKECKQRDGHSDEVIHHL